MEIKNHLKELLDTEKINKVADSGLLAWANEPDAKNKEILKKSKLIFHSHKYCFQSSAFDYPYFESTYEVMYKEKEIGIYRIISLTDGSIEDDYLEID